MKHQSGMKHKMKIKKKIFSGITTLVTHYEAGQGVTLHNTLSKIKFSSVMHHSNYLLKSQFT